ncbi:phosphonate ABC transporter ATP-binding protein [Evansella vedderi]|uniref:phosphonate ABC transporter ATP-binding protein n=1 Tax=Evansella vedderi TaxID=38282 RepID=UPI0027D7E923|nr:phosphonate ABC transporter ATP-binding protein [Evansella vedderi]
MIKAEQLEIVYPKRKGSETTPALQDISLTVEEEEFIAVIGKSGAGKTTFLRSLTGFVRPSAGKLVVNDIDVMRTSKKKIYELRRNVATIYQSFNLVERMTALDNALCGRLGYIGNIRGLLGLFPKKDKEFAYRTLVDLGLEDRVHYRVDQLSGGERQRVAIARALVQQPQIVLADEPAASLDISLTKFVLNTLKDLNKQNGLTVLVNLHDIELAKMYATRIIALQRGRIVFDGEPEKLTEDLLEVIYNEYEHGEASKSNE